MMIRREIESKIPYEEGRKMAKRKTYHVTSGPDGGWKVKEEKASRASSSHETKAQAVERAKELAKNQDLCQCRFKMSPFCRNKMSPDCRFHSERFSGSGCSSSPFGEGPNMPALRFSLSR